MKKQIILITIITLFTFKANAQDKSEAIKELFEVMQIEKMTSKILDNMLPAMQQQGKQLFKDEKKQDKYNTYMQFVMEEAKKTTVSLAKDDMPAIYAKHFSVEEIKDLTNFYKTATGKKMLEKTPEITKDMMQIMMQKQMPQFQQKIMTKIQELKKTEA
ncbi:DUF2059 domain-containing protein [Wenyingzhuangia sp. IMCC45574]